MFTSWKNETRREDNDDDDDDDDVGAPHTALCVVYGCRAS